MPDPRYRYRVNFGITYIVEDARDAEDAENKAYSMAHEDFGTLVNDMWMEVDDTWS